MAIIALIKRRFNSQEKRGSAIIMLIISLIAITPLCGFLFQCGCDWPWLGLDAKCNFYQPNSEHQCPWCASMATGVLSTGTAIVAGIWASNISIGLLISQPPIKEVLIRILFGVIIFVLIAAIAAKLAAFWQGYPL
jgi:hypothetical protein